MFWFTHIDCQINKFSVSFKKKKKKKKKIWCFLLSTESQVMDSKVLEQNFGRISLKILTFFYIKSTDGRLNNSHLNEDVYETHKMGSSQSHNILSPGLYLGTKYKVFGSNMLRNICKGSHNFDFDLKMWSLTKIIVKYIIEVLWKYFTIMLSWKLIGRWILIIWNWNFPRFCLIRQTLDARRHRQFHSNIFFGVIQISRQRPKVSQKAHCARYFHDS